MPADPSTEPPQGYETADEKSVELAARRTGMSFQRTRMSADRTLMSIIRTALSLIGFGFTIYQVFQKMQQSGMMAKGTEARNFGIALLALGMVLLTLSTIGHVRFMLGIREQRAEMKDEGLVHAQSEYPISVTLITALVLWLIGLVAIVSIVFQSGISL